jgi:succinyl-CoA synthetase beta subunit
MLRGVELVDTAEEV